MTATIATPIGSVEQFLADLRTDQSLQIAVSRSSVENILELCQQRGVYVNGQVLRGPRKIRKGLD